MENKEKLKDEQYLEEDIRENDKKNMDRKKKKHSPIAIIVKSFVALVVVAFLFVFGFTYQVREGSCAVIMRFGAVRSEITEAGLYLKLPWPFESVVSYDSRLQYLESNKLETTTKDQRNIILQSYVVWDIEDPVLYHKSVGVNGNASKYINDQVFSATNSTLGQYDLSALVSLKATELKLDEIQGKIYEKIHNHCHENYGVNVKDVSILRLSLPDTNLDSVFEQMWAEREGEISKIIAKAELDAKEIENGAIKDEAEIVGRGEQEAAKIKAQTEEDVAKIKANAAALNTDLFTFLTQLNTMVESVNSSTILVAQADKYPFNIIKDYSENMSPADDAVIIRDLKYILQSEKLSETDRNALVDAINQALNDAFGKIGEERPGNGTTPTPGDGGTATTNNGKSLALIPQNKSHIG